LKAARAKQSGQKPLRPIYLEAPPAGCPSTLEVLKKLLEDLNNARKLNAGVEPVSAFDLGVEAAERSSLLRSHFEQNQKCKPMFLSNGMKLATRTLFDSKPKQARGIKTDQLLGIIGLMHGCAHVASLTISEIKKLALVNYNRIISPEGISKSNIYNCIIASARSGSRDAKKKVIDPRKEDEN
jgi:hypothetical protein